MPELNAHCLRLALNTPKVTEQLMKLDEQGVRIRSEEIQQGGVTLTYSFECSYGKNFFFYALIRFVKRLYYRHYSTKIVSD